MTIFIYRMICLYMAFVIVVHLFRFKAIQQKIICAFMLIPFVLRALLIK